MECGAETGGHSGPRRLAANGEGEREEHERVGKRLDLKPLDWRSLQRPRIRHFTLEEKEPRDFQEWQELKLEANG